MMRLNDALELARSIIARLRGKEGGATASDARIECVGQIRRGLEMVDAVELLAAGDRRALISEFATLPQLAEVKSVREDRVEAETRKGVAVILHLAPEADFAAAMIRTTGSAEHLRDLETQARSRGLDFKGFKLAEQASARKAKKGKGKAEQIAATNNKTRLLSRDRPRFYPARSARRHWRD
jgi:DNA polymerase/3'-5' exonuclease PolX